MLRAPGDVEALATHIRRLADPRLRRRMGERARERVVASFDVEAMARRYEGLLMDLARSC